MHAPYLETFELDELLDPVYDEHVAVVIYVSDISGMEPTFIVDSSLGFFSIFVITYEDDLLTLNSRRNSLHFRCMLMHKT